MSASDFEDQCQDLDEAWECPTCLRPMPEEHDYECGTCEAKASEHLRVTTLCKLLRASQDRESALIVQRDRLAEALRELCETLLKDKPRDITDLLNKAGAALAAVKGGPQ